MKVAHTQGKACERRHQALGERLLEKAGGTACQVRVQTRLRTVAPQAAEPDAPRLWTIPGRQNVQVWTGAILWNLYHATGSREAWAGGLGKKVTGLF